MKFLCRSTFIVALCIHLSAGALAANWPAWRGADGLGVAREKRLPLNWTTNSNVRWKIPLPGPGNSTPIVWGNRVFVTQAVEKENHRTLMCFDRRDGKLLWQEGPTYAEAERTHETNPQAAPSPVTDGTRVIAWFGSAGLYCYDFRGREIWHRDLGKQSHIWGYGASPILHRDLCILNFGPGERSFIVAVDKKTGKTVWQYDEPGGHFGEPKPGENARDIWIGSWSTPIVVKAAGRDELVVALPRRVVAFDPLTGKELWKCGGLNPLAYTSPLFADGIIVAMGGFMGSTIAVRAGGNGDVSATHKLWEHPKTKQRIGSGVIHDGYIYILNDPGVAECFELKTGKLVWEERLKGPSAKADSWSSMVLAGDRIYVVNQGGDSFVLKASPKFELLATNPLGELTRASMAMSDGEIFIRTYAKLWCVGE